MSTIEVGLPDGRTLEVTAGATVLEVAEQIGPGLARAALAGRIAGALVDLRQPLTESCALEIVTSRDPEGGEVIRHSAEHVMADAVKRLFPDAQVDAGRADHSQKFQYDFKVAEPFTPEDLVAIQAEMKKIVKENAKFEREVVTRAEAEKLFTERGEMLKVERLADIPDGVEITLFRHGEFVDLCRGPHVRNAKQIGATQLLESAGAYFRGDESNEMLQRIYGTAFATKDELKEHLERIEQAKQRDHRVIGKQLGLFFLAPDTVGSGLAMWLPKGAVLRRELAAFLEEQLTRRGYEPVVTPHIGRVELYETSGHYPYYADSQFPPVKVDGGDEQYLLKPMNCPHHIQIYAHGQHSYRDLPMRLAEFGTCYRYEKSGELNGLTRVRALTVDDAHIFCTPEQVEAEFTSVLEFVQFVLKTFAFEDVKVSLSARDPDDDKYAGDPKLWDQAEATLARVLDTLGMDYVHEVGEAAFYGPKVDFHVTDVIGRSWQLGTAQLDYVLPERFGLEYKGADGELHRPVMIHRAPFGSFERFIGILIEHFAGDFPLWLAPVQVAILPIADRHHDYASKVASALRAAGLRSFVDDRSEKLNYKIREAELQKIPIMCVIGDQEEEAGTVSPRIRRAGEHRAEALAVDAFVEDLAGRVARREV